MIRFLILFSLCINLSLAQYQKGNIDMHGGKSDKLFEQKSGFSQSNSSFLGSSLKNKKKDKTPKKQSSQQKSKQ